MTLEDRLAFIEALLDHKPENEWKQYRPQHQSVYHGTFALEGRDVSGTELIREYAKRFPADREYSDRGTLNRMLLECGVPKFSFTDPEVMRGFLHSARSPVQWSKYQPSYHTFWTLDFKHMGIDIKGQMLLYNLFVELENQRNGTFYAFVDYTPERNPEMYKQLQATRSGAFIARAFEIAGLTVKSKSILQEDLTPERLREILLTRRTEEEWENWQGGHADFKSTWFDLDGYKNFAGASLRRHYQKIRGEDRSVKDMFSEAGIKVGGNPELLRKTLEDRFERFYGVFDDPVAVRDLFLQMNTEEGWAKPQQYSPLRKQKVAINGDRSVSIHTLLHLFSIYKYNAEQETIDTYIDFNKAQSEEHKGLIQSNKKALGELLDFAGLEYKFIPDITEVDLHDSTVLRRMLFHATLEGETLSHNDLKNAGIQQFRKARFRDPATGVDIAGQSLMIYFSALYYVKEHPEVGLDEAATTLHKGKSNSAVMGEILEKAGLHR
ncbi:hypothetical protein HYX11_02435 [Candidatus Woesearchaeota archaeon]|nr:hypothetical protein [Candidatus Woesearchaeota archaeon]